MASTLVKSVRVSPELWARIERMAAERGVSANAVMIEIMEGGTLALDFGPGASYPPKQTAVMAARPGPGRIVGFDAGTGNPIYAKQPKPPAL